MKHLMKAFGPQAPANELAHKLTGRPHGGALSDMLSDIPEPFKEGLQLFNDGFFFLLAAAAAKA